VVFIFSYPRLLFLVNHSLTLFGKVKSDNGDINYAGEPRKKGGFFVNQHKFKKDF